MRNVIDYEDGASCAVGRWSEDQGNCTVGSRLDNASAVIRLAKVGLILPFNPKTRNCDRCRSAIENRYMNGLAV